MKRIEIPKLIFSILICEAVGIISSLITAGSIASWYVDIEKPVLSPPSWIFGPVWTTLYALMGIAAYLIWREGAEKREVKQALALFAIQLALNFIWSPIFFGLENLGLALGVIILMWFAILATIIAFGRLSKTAAALLVPYLLWVSFATYLNWAIWTLN